MPRYMTAIIVIFNNEKSDILEVYGYPIEGKGVSDSFTVWPDLCLVRNGYLERHDRVI